MTPRLKQQYNDEVKAALKAQLGLDNDMLIPTLDKIVLNMGVGDAMTDKKLIDGAVDDLMTITGQRPKVNIARKSIANFKLREGVAIGASVTLRGDRMWEFFDRLVAVAIPRIRDFRGLNLKSFDGGGNYSMGVTEQLIFPEVDFASIDRVRGLQVNIVTTARTDEEGRRLLALLGMPFARRD